MTKGEYEGSLNEFRLHLSIMLILRSVIRTAMVAGLILGLGILLLRAAVRFDHFELAWVVVIPVLLLGLISARRKIPAKESIRAMLDRSSECGGLLMASGETNTDQWDSQIPGISKPKIRWNGKRDCGLLIVSIFFLALCVLVPIRYISAPPSTPMNVRREANKIIEKIKALEELEIIEQERAEDMKEKLEEVVKRAIGEDPIRTWEAMDHIDRDVNAAGDLAAEKQKAAIEELNEAKALTDALAECKDKLKEENLASAMSELSELINKATKATKEIGTSNKEGIKLSKKAEEMLKEAMEGMKGMELTEEQLKELAEALEKCQNAGKDSLKRMAKAGMIGKEELKRMLKGLSPEDVKELEKLLMACNGDGKGNIKLAIKGWVPGRPGVSRGKGDAPMSWKNETKLNKEGFKPVLIPPGAISPKKTRLSAVSKGDPGSKEDIEKSKTGALKNATEGGGSAATRKLLPRHREAVDKYFTRDK